MTDEIRKLVSDKLDEIGMTMKEASTKIGRNESFVHQFLKRGHPAELRERDREKLAQVLGIPPDDLRWPVTPLPSSMNGPTSKNCASDAALTSLPCARSPLRSPTAAPPRFPQRPCACCSNERIRALQAAGAMILRDVTAASTISASQRRVCWSAWDEHRIARDSRRASDQPLSRRCRPISYLTAATLSGLRHQYPG